MTVQELIDLLMKVENKDRVVILQRDPEGNSYSPAVLGVDDNAVWDDPNRDVKKERLTAALIARGFGYEDMCPGGDPAVVLWPIW